ncbi:MAG: EpsD family peptidyl-prolyl cis-trans isomerase [Inhella sp.]
MWASAAKALGGALLLALIGCAPPDEGQRAVVKVNRETITARQWQEAVERQPATGPEQRAAMAPQVLERLIDQELALQQAEAMKLERDPKVAAQLEAARRELLARAYAQTLSAQVPQPTSAEVEAHYRERPALYAQRLVFSVQELSIDGSAEQIAALQALVPPQGDPTAWLRQAKAAGLRASATPALRPAEHWPAAALTTLTVLADGQTTVLPRAGGLLVVQRLGVQSAAVTLEQARPVIEQQLLAERRLARIQAVLKALRARAESADLGVPRGAASAP